jgi:exopolysaccharide production protein ExoZ
MKTMTKNTEKRGYRMLDVWRGVASLAVVMVHSYAPVAKQYPALAHQLWFSLSSFGFLGVPMFFVISGYCIVNAAVSSFQAQRGIGAFFHARFLRIYPPYWCTTFAAILLSSAIALLAHHGIFRDSNLAKADFFHQSLVYYFSTLTLTQVPLHQTRLVVVFWTLCYEVAFYLIVGFLLLPMFRRLAIPSFLNIFHSITLSALLWLIVAPATCLFPLDLWPQFGFGILVFDWLRHADKKRPKILFGVMSILLLCFITVGDPTKLGYARGIQFGTVLVFAPVLMILARFDEFLMRWKPVQWLANVGVFSYSLYLTHILSLGIVSQIGKKLGVTQETYIYSDLGQIVFALIVAYVFYQYCELPFHRLAKRKPTTNSVDTHAVLPIAS